MQLQLLPSHKIDEQKWDACLYNSVNPLIYASSVYLNNMTDNWDGIIADDYAAVMPIPWKKKFGIKYCCNVPFIQQLGLFSEATEEQKLNEFAMLLLQSFRYGDYAFNHANNLEKGRIAKNYILSLASNYRSLSFFYSDNLKANLEKAAQQSFEYRNADAEQVIHLFRELYAGRFPHVILKDYNNFSNLCKIKEAENNLIACEVVLNKKVLAMNLLLKDKYRIYSLMPCVTDEGRALCAGHFLFDRLIKEFSQTGLMFDFEGSDIPGIENFNKSFGAINQPYRKIHINRLLPFLRLLKH